MATNHELRHLRSFVVAGELEHFGRAAERLAIVQPALSRQIRELEEAVGAPLFERLPRGVRLTAAGRAYLDEARAILAAVERAAWRAREVAQGRTGVLRVGFVDTTIYHSRLPAMCERFRRKYPGVRLELVQQTSLELGARLREGALDLAFVFHLPENLPGLRSRPLLTEDVRLAVPRAHPLARRRPVRLEHLRDESFVWIPRAVSPPFHDRVVAACRRAGFTPRVVQEAQTDVTVLSLVAAGAGLTFCVASSANRKPRGVAVVRIADLGVSFTLHAAWRGDSPNPALAGMLELVGPGAE